MKKKVFHIFIIVSSLPAPKFEKPPIVGQLVLAKFVDENYYRAIVTKVVDGKIGVSYVDFGNDDVTTIDGLRVLSDDLKDVG